MIHHVLSRRCPCGLLTWAAAVATAGLAAAAPAIDNVSLRGLQAGATTTLIIDGSELLPEPTVLLGAPIVKQVVKPGATPQRIEVEITLHSQAQTAIYPLRVANAGGVSNAVAVGVDPLPQLPFASQISSLPAALSGALSGNALLATSFAGKKGERIVVDVESRRLGANLNPLIHLYDGRRVQLAWSQALSAIGGDARCEVVLPADGQYTVELHDAIFRGGDPGFFRLKIGELNYADSVFPMGVQRGAKVPLEYVATNLPQSSRVLVDMAHVGAEPAPWPAGISSISGSPPPVIVSNHAEVVEAEQPAGQVQELPAAPVAVNGRLMSKGEVDRYRLPVTGGSQLRFDVLASRFGSPLDGVLTILNEQGAQLATNDDRPGTSDPGLDLTVPGDVKAVIVSLRDLSGAGSEKHIYRIAIAPLGDFTLSLFEDRLQVPKDSTALVRVRANRTGYNGPIKLRFEGLKSNLAISGAEIPAGASDALLTLGAPGLNPVQEMATICGESTDPSIHVERPALLEETSLSKRQPWLRSQVVVAVTSPAPLAVDWDALAADARLLSGSPLAAKVKVARAAGQSGAARLTLVTSQIMPKKTVKEPNKPDKLVDDLDRALRLDGAPQIAAGQNDGAVSVLVPADLPPLAYDLAIKAELLGPDGKSVVATAVTPARRLIAAKP